MAREIKDTRLQGQDLNSITPSPRGKALCKSQLEFFLPIDRQSTADEIKAWMKNELNKYFYLLIGESTMFSHCKMLEAAGNKFSRMLAEGKLSPANPIKGKIMKGEQPINPKILDLWLR